MIIYKNIVLNVAEFSNCCKKKVGAIIVSKFGEIVASGYNKSINIDCYNHFKKIWEEKEKNKIIDKIGTQLDFEQWCKTDENFKQEHRIWSSANEIHAEIHALNVFNPKRNNMYSMFITLEPCIECAKAIIINEYINEIFYINEFKKNSGIELLKKHSIKVQKI